MRRISASHGILEMYETNMMKMGQFRFKLFWLNEKELDSWNRLYFVQKFL